MNHREGNHALSELLERYATLRDTMQGLEIEKESLAKQIKEALEKGEQAETDLYHAKLKISRRTEYPIERFREVFGDAAALEVSVISNKKADTLVMSGDLDGEALKNIALVKEVAALILIPKTI